MWKIPAPAVADLYSLVAGEWYCPIDGPVTTQQPTEGQTRYLHLTAVHDMVLDGIGVDVTVAGSAGALVRFVAKVDTGGRPAAATLWSSSGLAAEATGLVSTDPGLALARGDELWLGCNVQGGAVTRPTLRALNVRHGPVPGGTGAAACWLATGETGGTFGQPSAGNANPIAIMIRRE